jgi:hypothetical protein
MPESKPKQLPTNLGIYRQDAKFAKVDLLTKNLNFLGGLGVLAVNFLKLLALPHPPAGFWCYKDRNCRGVGV